MHSIVVDSNSCDRTIEIAQQYPVRTITHAFESHGQQRTWMLENVPTKYDWAYILECDERMTPELFQECLAACKSHQHCGYYVAERVMFMNRWIRHSTQYPRYQLRLLRKGQVWFTDYGHAEREIYTGTVGFLQETYPHYTCSKGFSRWIEKHNRYSTDEATEMVHQLENQYIDWKTIFLGETEVQRRQALKQLAFHLPCRPLLRFLYIYFGLKSFLDGKAGFTWCVLQIFYEYLILLKVWEIKQRQILRSASIPVPHAATGKHSTPKTEPGYNSNVEIASHAASPCS